MHSNAFLCIHVLVDQDPHSSLASLVVFCPRGAAHLLLGYRYTTATRLDVYSTTHRCVELSVEWPCFTEAKSVPPSRD